MYTYVDVSLRMRRLAHPGACAESKGGRPQRGENRFRKTCVDKWAGWEARLMDTRVLGKAKGR